MIKATFFIEILTGQSDVVLQRTAAIDGNDVVVR